MQFVKGLISKMKTKRSPLDVSDFVAARPAPSATQLWERIDARYMGSTMDPKHLEVHKKRMLFDLKYRCGAEGRCMEGDFRCRFPCCFQMRPSIKGAEIFMERLGLEEKVAPRNHDLATLLSKEQLEEALLLMADRVKEMETKTAPAAMSASTLDEYMNLVCLHATILMNSNRDAEAVDFLLERAPRVPRAAKLELLSTATNWATLNDMEIRFYSVHVVHFPELDGPKARSTKPPLLKKVIDACKNDDEAEDHVVHAVVGKEVTGIIARAQNAQDYEDFCEDPMATSVVRDSVDHYRHVIGGSFWAKFFHLAMMPPLDPRDNPPETAPEETPRNVLDALGRSMLLHHIAKSFDADFAQTPEDANAKARKMPQDMTKEELERLPKDQRIALKRMQELLMIVKNYSGPTKAGTKK